MAVSATATNFKIELATAFASGTGAKHNVSANWGDALTDSSGDILFDRVFALEDYSLTTAAGNLDVDLYDLGTLDVGAGAGRDNSGLDHANARIIAIAIRNQEVTGNGTLRIDQIGAGTTAWTGFGHADLLDDMTQGETLARYFGESGRTVTDVTDHILRLSAQTNDCTIDVIFWSKQS